MKLQRLCSSTATIIVAIATVLSLGACAPERGGAEPTENPNNTQSDNAESSIEETAPENDQLVMKVPNASDLTVPLDQTSVTVYYTGEDAEMTESAIKRLRMMGIVEISVKKATGTDSPIVAYRSPDYEEAAESISDNLHVTPCLEIPDDGSSGWRYDSDIAVVVSCFHQ